MNRKRLASICLPAAMCAALSSACAPDTPVSGTPQPGEAHYVTLAADLDRFRSDFNALAGQLRLVFISGPSCGVCLRGMDDLNRSIVASIQDDPRIHTLVLYVPTLGADEKHVAAAVPLMQGPRVSHYWDPHGRSGLEFQHALHIPMYAWDVWMLYEPGARWPAEGPPPAPALWQHQLSGLDPGNRLDAEEFARVVRRRLAELRDSAT